MGRRGKAERQVLEASVDLFMSREVSGGNFTAHECPLWLRACSLGYKVDVETAHCPPAHCPSPTFPNWISWGQTHRTGSILQEVWMLAVKFPEKQEDRVYAGL